MNTRIRIMKGHYREEGGSLTPGSLTLIDMQDKGVCAENGGEVRARRYQVTGEVEGLELYGNEIAFVFLPDEGECERVGIPVDA
ncbi:MULTISPECIES: hypothetical protein [unclassified Pseudomonas]|uniref:hypothetical protein n=1 Tax=unclassified Pseudomonas TaxID=196821 RepID=UPI0011A5B7E7|nr:MULTISPECIES: hypothetical protein [unclassified Pseudomonas]TWC12498.1 hypothetical protein FBY00_12511 [Pseudomonas sp. SJZ075]TWC28946.1 hypothetical protein FBY02_12679 [Pseudomonas sp. SJZ078]TWC49480.1 hypothetical protein FBY11_12579 [Pseudomonas sp. SJZ124]TWC84656.1 hypothetical protein FBY09_12511 [Pseudomonas sp. SJZ101]